MTEWSGRGYDGPYPVNPQLPTPTDAGPGQFPPPVEWPGAPSGPQWQPDASYSGPPPVYGVSNPGRPPRRNRKTLFITLGAGAAVLVVVVIVLVVTLGGGSNGHGGAGSAADAVKGYLSALSRGDAEAALAYGDDQAASKEFLTDDILKQQIAHWPISNVRILNDDSTGASIGMGQIHVAANFGDQVSDGTLRTKRIKGRWYLESAAVKLQPMPGGSINAAGKTVTVFGKPVGDNTTYVFPGYVDIGGSNPYIGVKAKPLLLDSLTSYAPWIQAEFSLNDAGSKAVTDALSSAFDSCRNSTALRPPAPCPLKGLDATDYVDGTAHWGTADLSQVKNLTFDQFHLSVMFFGSVSMPVTVQYKSGRVGDGTIKPFLSGSADISKVPPTLSFQ